MSQVSIIQLDKGWLWKQRNPAINSPLDEVVLPEHNDILQGWNATKSFPSEIHVELLKSNKIPDPYIGFNEHQVQCEPDLFLGRFVNPDPFPGVGNVEWLYKLPFTFDLNTLHNFALLEFEGLDTICDIYLASGLVIFGDSTHTSLE